jgi:hypothetical protein
MKIKAAINVAVREPLVINDLDIDAEAANLSNGLS